jgi:hypothetical protein
MRGEAATSCRRHVAASGAAGASSVVIVSEPSHPPGDRCLEAVMALVCSPWYLPEPDAACNLEAH